MVTVRQWTGLEATALQAALRMSVRDFADYLGVAVRTVTDWRRRKTAICPKPWMQEALDTALETASSAARARFDELLMCQAEPPPKPPAPTTDGLDELVVRVMIDGEERLVPIDRRTVLGIGARMALDPGTDSTAPRVRPSSPSQLDDLLNHLRDAWHVLVRADNLLGPRHALGGVLRQINTIHDLLDSTSFAGRRELVRIAAQYAESLSWLYEDAGSLAIAKMWCNQAMDWAHEAQDSRMLAWILFRRSQQAAAEHNPAQVLGLARAASDVGVELPSPMRAAIAQQMGFGCAMDDREAEAQRWFDEAHRWAAADVEGDAREGHGSFCTSTYIELRRAESWLLLRRPHRAVDLFQAAISELPSVYHRDRGMALGRLATAFAAVDEPEVAAQVGLEALEIAESVGSARTSQTIRHLGPRLERHRRLPKVNAFLQELNI